MFKNLRGGVFRIFRGMKDIYHRHIIKRYSRLEEKIINGKQKTCKQVLRAIKPMVPAQQSLLFHSWLQKCFAEAAFNGVKIFPRFKGKEDWFYKAMQQWQKALGKNDWEWQGMVIKQDDAIDILEEEIFFAQKGKKISTRELIYTDMD